MSLVSRLTFHLSSLSSLISSLIKMHALVSRLRLSSLMPIYATPIRPPLADSDSVTCDLLSLLTHDSRLTLTLSHSHLLVHVLLFYLDLHFTTCIQQPAASSEMQTSEMAYIFMHSAFRTPDSLTLSRWCTRSGTWQAWLWTRQARPQSQPWGNGPSLAAKRTRAALLPCQQPWS